MSLLFFIYISIVPLETGGHLSELNTKVAGTTPEIPADLNGVNIDSLISLYSNQYGVSEKDARDIMWCESRIKPFAVNHNKTKDGVIWSTDVGYWQLNDYYWEEYLLNLGWDIHDPIQNLEAGFYIMSVYGKDPWVASNNCHGLLNH